MPVVIPSVHTALNEGRHDGARRTVKATGSIAEVGIAPVCSSAEFTALLMVNNPHEPQAPDQAVRLVWQGQRSVPGISVGVTLECVGVLSRRDNHPTMYNPRYEIKAKKVRR